MSTKKKKLFISEENYKSDFEQLLSFYEYHVKRKDISITLDEVQGFGVTLEAKKREEISKIKNNSLLINTIIFSSSKKKYNVKNLFWYIRCLVAHPENIKKKNINGVECYKICCITKNNKTDKTIPTMKGLVNCDIWPKFIDKLVNKIKEKEV